MTSPIEQRIVQMDLVNGRLILTGVNKLITNWEAAWEWADTYGGAIELHKPQHMMQVATQKGQVAYQFQNYMGTPEVQISGIIAIDFNPTKQLIDSYIQLTTGLQLASSIPPSAIPPNRHN